MSILLPFRTSWERVAIAPDVMSLIVPRFEVVPPSPPPAVVLPILPGLSIGSPGPRLPVLGSTGKATSDD